MPDLHAALIACPAATGRHLKEMIFDRNDTLPRLSLTLAYLILKASKMTLEDDSFFRDVKAKDAS